MPGAQCRVLGRDTGALRRTPRSPRSYRCTWAGSWSACDPTTARHYRRVRHAQRPARPTVRPVRLAPESTPVAAAVGERCPASVIGAAAGDVRVAAASGSGAATAVGCVSGVSSTPAPSGSGLKTPKPYRPTRPGLVGMGSCACAARFFTGQRGPTPPWARQAQAIERRRLAWPAASTGSRDTQL